MHFGAAHGPPGGPAAEGGGQQGLYNFPKMKWQTCGKHSES